jgi:hypothetical protein
MEETVTQPKPNKLCCLNDPAASTGNWDSTTIFQRVSPGRLQVLIFFSGPLDSLSL